MDGKYCNIVLANPPLPPKYLIGDLNLLNFVILLLIITHLLTKQSFTRKDIVNIKSNSSNKTQENTTIKSIKSLVSFSDIAGLKKAKDELLEIVDFLKNPQKYKNLNARIPKGILLVGPPGVGKTMLAKALSNEVGVPFFYQSGSSFVEIYVGMGAKRVKELFLEAKKNAPSIIFIDEIDSVGKKRGDKSNDERDSTLNQLLTEMDGFDSNSGVIVLGATNKQELLDEALLRDGRFDRRIVLELPSFDSRVEIFKIYLKNIKYTLNIEKLAKLSASFSASAIENFINEAKLQAIRNNRDIIYEEDFLNIKDKIVFGQFEKKLLNEEEKEKIALYQTSKAFIAKKLGLVFEKISLFQDSFLQNKVSIKSEKEYFYEIVSLYSGMLAFDKIYHTKYDNAKKDTKELKKKIGIYLNLFDIENKLSSDTILSKAREIFEENFKEEKIQDLKIRLKEKEILFFEEI